MRPGVAASLPCGDQRRLGILEGFAFVVAEEHALLVAEKDVVGIDGDFAAAAGSIDDELGDCVAGGVAAELLDDLDALHHAGAQVRAALDEIALVEVVGAHTAHEQLVHEAFHHARVVVHTAEEHALIAERHAVVGEHGQGITHLGGELARVVRVDAHPQRVVLLQDAAKLRRDALRHKDGHAGADADEFDVLDRAQPGEQRVELRIGEEQGIAAGEQHIAHLGVFFEVAEGGLELGVQLLLADAAHHAAAGAVTAVAGAAVGDEEEHAVRVAVDEAGHGHVAVLAAGVGHLIGIVPGLLDARDNLPADWAVGIVGVDEIEIVRCDGHCQLVPGEQHAGAFLLAKLEVLLELGERGDAVAELPGGAVPLL